MGYTLLVRLNVTNCIHRTQGKRFLTDFHYQYKYAALLLVTCTRNHAEVNVVDVFKNAADCA